MKEEKTYCKKNSHPVYCLCYNLLREENLDVALLRYYKRG